MSSSKRDVGICTSVNLAVMRYKIASSQTVVGSPCIDVVHETYAEVITIECSLQER